MEFRSFDAPRGERLDVAMAAALELSRTYAKELVDEGHVQVNGRPVGKASLKLKGDETVTVMLPPPKPMRVEAEDIPLEIIYEDQDLAAINKPPKLVAHPTATIRKGTVVNALLGRMQLSKENLSDPVQEVYRPGIVHRLDKDTTGVMVIAKHDNAHKALADAFKKRLTEKEYIAIAVGDIEDDFRLEAAIGRHPVNRQKMTVGGSNLRSATTYFKVLERIPGYVLLKVKPHTGRTHQIRVHLAHLNASILGDELYGKASTYIKRQALHAFRLTLPHPRDNEAITFVAQVPVDMVDTWLKLGGSWLPETMDGL